MVKNSPIPVIIDTDFGGDADDAVALTYALASSEIVVKAILTSDEYLRDSRARVIIRWLQAQHLDIPVFAGQDLGNTRLFFLSHYVDSNYSIPDINSPQLGEILHQVATENGCYLAIGGLTNTARLLRRYPNIAQHLKFYVMGGAIHYRRPGVAEHNIRLDVAAAKEVFQANLNIRWLLSDATFTPAAKISRQHPLYEYFSQWDDLAAAIVESNMDGFFDKMFPDSCMHDPMLVSSVFLPTVKYAQTKLSFAPTGEFREDDEGREILVSRTADYDLFWDDIYRKLKLTSHVHTS